MEKVMVEMYKCNICGKLFEDEASCTHHEDKVCARKSRWCSINEKWEKGHTLGQINEEYRIIKKLPDEIRSATKNTVLLYENSKHQMNAKGIIEKFVSSHIILVSRDTKFERMWWLGYSDFKYMNILEDTNTQDYSNN